MKQTVNKAVEAEGKEHREPIEAERLPREVHSSADAIFEIAIFFAWINMKFTSNWSNVTWFVDCVISDEGEGSRTCCKNMDQVKPLLN